MIIFQQNPPRRKSKKIEQCLRINFKEEPSFLDPRRGRNMCGTSQLHAMLFEGLMRMEHDGSLSCAQAQSYVISADKKTYVFHLRETFWSDGSPVTAHDFAHTWKTILDPQFFSNNTPPLFCIKNGAKAKKGEVSLDHIGIHAQNAKTLIVELEYPLHYFLQLTASSALLPVHCTQADNFPDWDAEAGERLLCNGPFKLADWKPDREMLLKKNRHYYRAEQIKLDTIHISYINQGIAPLHIGAAGFFDVIGPPLSFLPHDLSRELTQKNLLQIVNMPGTVHCIFNTARFPFHNIHMRKAFSYAIDRQFIVETTTLLKEQPALGAIPPLLKNRPLTPFFKNNDIKKARAHFKRGLTELGITAADLENKLSFCFWKHDHGCPLLPQALQKQWEEVLGVDVPIEAMEFKALHDRGANGHFNMGLFVHVSVACESLELLSRFKFAIGPRNYSQWENKDYIDLLNRAGQVDDLNQRATLLEQAEKILMEEMPIAPLFYWNNAFLVQPHVEGFALSPLGHLCLDHISIKKRT